MKLMICHDGSEKSQQAMEKAIEMFRCQKPEVTVVTIVELPLDATSHDEVAYDDWKQSRDKDLKNACDWVALKGLEADCILAEGDPRTMIMEAINKKKPDVVVVSRRGKGRILGMVLGSVSAYVSRHAPCPVLIMG